MQNLNLVYQILHTKFNVQFKKSTLERANKHKWYLIFNIQKYLMMIQLHYALDPNFYPVGEPKNNRPIVFCPLFLPHSIVFCTHCSFQSKQTVDNSHLHYTAVVLCQLSFMSSCCQFIDFVLPLTVCRCLLLKWPDVYCPYMVHFSLFFSPIWDLQVTFLPLAVSNLVLPRC